MGYLGSRQQTGVPDPNNKLGTGNWTVAFRPADFQIQNDFEINHIAVMGPIGSQFQIWIDSEFYDYVAHGDVNSWDPSNPMYLQPGRTVYFYYSVNTPPAPFITVRCREPLI